MLKRLQDMLDIDDKVYDKEAKAGGRGGEIIMPIIIVSGCFIISPCYYYPCYHGSVADSGPWGVQAEY